MGFVGRLWCLEKSWYCVKTIPVGELGIIEEVEVIKRQDGGSEQVRVELASELKKTKINGKSANTQPSRTVGFVIIVLGL